MNTTQKKEPTCINLITTLQSATKHFLTTTALVPTERQDAVKELQTVINQAEPQVEKHVGHPSYAQLLVTIGVAKQELTRAGVEMH